jgi:hypothetical protein
MGLIQKFKDLFFKPDVSDQERIDRWKIEVDEADRIKELHRQSRKQTTKSKVKRSLKIEDFDRANQSRKHGKR